MLSISIAQLYVNTSILIKCQAFYDTQTADSYLNANFLVRSKNQWRIQKYALVIAIEATLDAFALHSTHI
jgi:hypothetical protein